MAKGTWNAEAKALIKRFAALKPRTGSFDLRPGVTVLDGEKFHQLLADEIAGGPLSARGRIGAIVTDLRDYVNKLEGRSPEKTEHLPGKIEP